MGIDKVITEAVKKFLENGRELDEIAYDVHDKFYNLIGKAIKEEVKRQIGVKKSVKRR